MAGRNEDTSSLLEMGVTITEANQISNWYATAAAEFGDGTSDDQHLGFALQSVRWNTPPGIDITMDVQEGQSYKLQLLFGEACCDRGFDIFVEGEVVVDNLLMIEIQGGINNAVGVAYTYEFTAAEAELNITLGGLTNGVPDNNPILQVLTLEKLVTSECVLNSGGDLDGNLQVDFADFLMLSANFGLEVSTHALGDIDCNGKVEFGDFLILSANFGQQIGGTETVPEPSMGLSGLCVMLVLLCGGRRARTEGRT